MKELNRDDDDFAKAKEFILTTISNSVNLKSKEFKEALEEESLSKLGYFLAPKYLFHHFVDKAKKKEFFLDDLTSALKKVEESTQGYESEDDFLGLFDDVDLTSAKQGKTVAAKNDMISRIFLHLDQVDFYLEDSEMDVLGDAYEYLIGQFASGAGKKAGEFYTPQEVSKTLSKIVTLGKDRIKSAYDPTCGSGSLLLRISQCNAKLHTSMARNLIRPPIIWPV